MYWYGLCNVMLSLCILFWCDEDVRSLLGTWSSRAWVGLQITTMKKLTASVKTRQREDGWRNLPLRFDCNLHEAGGVYTTVLLLLRISAPSSEIGGDWWGGDLFGARSLLRVGRRSVLHLWLLSRSKLLRVPFMFLWGGECGFGRGQVFARVCGLRWKGTCLWCKTVRVPEFFFC